ncbi:MAG: hypothetical protein IJ659_03805 [Alloprevotella sp.]|nr:hypothetical protein [Alloprevotella sp.]
MKRFISILTMALLLFAGNAFAQSSSRMEVTLDFNSGSLVDANPFLLAPLWESANSPKVSVRSNYGNYITGTSNGYVQTDNNYIAFFAGSSYTPYTVTIEDGYSITGYSIMAYTQGEEYQIGFSEGNHYFDFGENEVEEVVEFGATQSFTFRLAGENAWLMTRLTLYIESEKVAPVRYVIKGTDGNTLLEQTLVGEVGTTISELPENLKRAYTTYEYASPVTVARDKENTFEAVATFNLPFSTDEGTRYFVNLGGRDFLLYAANVDIFSAKEEPSLADSLSLEFQWMFEGDPYRGIGLRNAATDRYAIGFVSAGSQYTAQYSDLAEEFAGWNIVDASDVEKGGFKLYMNGTDYLCIYNYNFYVSNQDYFYADRYGLITLTPVPDYEPVEVTYVVVDKDGQEVARESEYKLAGDRVSDIPDHMKRGFCSYKLDNAFKAATGGDNVMKAVVTYNLPFQTREENPRAWYCLTVDNNLLLGALTMDDGTVQGYAFGQKDGFSYEEYTNEPICWWSFSGNPYAGFTLRNADTNLYLCAAASDYAYVRMDQDLWYVGEGTNKGITLTNAMNDNHLYYVEGTDQFYNFSYSAFITSFQLLKVAEDRVGISSVAASSAADGACYDLQGRKVANPQAGVYVKEGRKYLRMK